MSLGVNQSHTNLLTEAYRCVLRVLFSSHCHYGRIHILHYEEQRFIRHQRRSSVQRVFYNIIMIGE